jgi:ABC-2 type transporter
MEKVKLLTHSIQNGENVSWFEHPHRVMKLEQLRSKHPLSDDNARNNEVSEFHQLKVLLNRGVIKAKRDQTLTHLRIGVNIGVAALLGWVYFGSGNKSERVLDNYNLLFTILMHHMMSTMMLTILTCKSNVNKSKINQVELISSLEIYFSPN